MCPVQNDFGPKYKHLQNLITKKLYSLLAVDGDSFVSQSGFQVIAYLHNHRDSQITQKDIEKALMINRATTSKMLRLLEQKGFITRDSNNDDGRSKVVGLTMTGEALYKYNREKLQEFDALLETVLTEEDFAAFDRIYEKLKAALSEE